MYNAATAKYVMWMHIDSSNYGEAKAGVATSDSLMSSTVAENYDLQMTSTENETDEKFNRGASQPLGYQSRDLNVFKGVWT
ncbi:hypothetical protein ACHAPF_000604 [Botrytis cinerea]